MTFNALIRLLYVLDHDGEILVMEDLSYHNPNYDDYPMCQVDKIYRDSDINDCLKYFKDPKYHLYVYERYKEYWEMEELI